MNLFNLYPWMNRSTDFDIIPGNSFSAYPYRASKFTPVYSGVCLDRASEFTPVYSEVCHAYPYSASEFTPINSGVCHAQSLLLCVVFYSILYVFLSYFIWPLYCLSSNYIFWLRCPRLLSSNLYYCISFVYNSVDRFVVYQY